MSDDITVPDWIYPGAEVVLYEGGRADRDDPTIYRATVGKVAKLSFVVVFDHLNKKGAEERIYLRTLESKNYGGTWHRWCYRVLEPTSELAAKLAATKARSATRWEARRAMIALTEQNRNERMDDLNLIRQAIKALAAHADLVLDQDGATDKNSAKD